MQDTNEATKEEPEYFVMSFSFDQQYQFTAAVCSFHKIKLSSKYGMRFIFIFNLFVL
jgi:hypothetical protein